MDSLSSIPAWGFWMMGVIVFANIGTIVTVLILFFKTSFKVTWWAAKVDFRLDHIEEHHKKDIDAAHEKIRYWSRKQQSEVRV